MDYKKVGFKSGLEVHIQLDVGKLFCKCTSKLNKGKPDFTLKRELKPMAGETGKVDIAALYEQKKKLYYIYEGFNEVTCEVELDEEPPKKINEKALETALIVAKIFNCKIPDVFEVMRKTVVDGSNVSGFQRTLLVGKDGWFTLKNGKKIGINYLILEEEAARRTAEDKKSVTFRLDRLGIPLLEIVTAPDLANAEEVKEAAERIGALVGTTGRRMRGIGTIRQDINISVKGHPRIEVKGVQDLRHVPKVVDTEIKRQVIEVKKKTKIFQHVRNVKEDFTTKFLRPLPGAARMYPETDLPTIKVTRDLLSLKIPEMPEERLKRYMNLGLSEDLAKQIASGNYEYFDYLISMFKKVEPKFIANLLLSLNSEVKKKLNLDFFEHGYCDMEYCLNLIAKNKISKDSVLNIFIDVAKGKNIEDAAKSYIMLSDAELKKEIKKIKAANKGLAENALIGKVMSKLRGKADSKKIIELIKKIK